MSEIPLPENGPLSRRGQFLAALQAFAPSSHLFRNRDPETEASYYAASRLAEDVQRVDRGEGFPQPARYSTGAPMPAEQDDDRDPWATGMPMGPGPDPHAEPLRDYRPRWMDD